MSPSPSVAATVPTGAPASLFSSTVSVDAPSKDGTVCARPVVPLPDADQPLAPSALTACTCTRYAVSAFRSEIVVFVRVSVCSCAIQFA